MRTITPEELQNILEKHKKRLEKKPDGERADLRGADLRWADLRWADLHETDLSWTDLRWADLRGTNLSGADLDFSVWPLNCETLHIGKCDARLAAQLLYHACALPYEDPDFIRARNACLEFANRFHRVKSGEVKKLVPIEIPDA
jgi:uncharacterized protein YjbI with pentapeptide repeats